MSLRIFFLGMLLWTSLGWADTSSVYLCRRDGSANSDYVVRMKKYFDAKEKMDLGKVERISNAQVLDTAHTKVYQIPVFNEEFYVQLWHGDGVILDAQLFYDQGDRPFHAIYKKNDERLELICQEIIQ